MIGGKDKEYWIEPDRHKMSTLGISPDQLNTVLAQTNFIKSNGYLSDYHYLYLSITDATIKTKADLENLILSRKNNRIVRVRDIAEVSIKEGVAYTRINANGKDAILVAVIKQPNANLVDLSAEMEARIIALRKILPDGVTIKPYYQQADFVEGSVKSVSDSLLAGLALASLAGAAIALILNLAPNPYIALEITYWLLGSLRDRSMAHVWLATPFMVVSWILLLFNARAYRLLTLGEDAAASLGVNLARTRLFVVLGSALGIGAAVSVAGSISFIGLIAPHLVRRFYGFDPARIMIPSALAGACLLIASDIVVRLVSGAVEIKIGVVTALIGVPFFLAMIFRERRLLEDVSQ